MSLEKILAISGKPGLYKLKNQTRSGFLAESLIDGKTINVSGRHNVSLLSEIAIYTLTEEVPLSEVFRKIDEQTNGKETISHKASKDDLEEFFFSVLPDYDEDRVYASDIKKVVQWYNLLVKNGLNDFSAPEKVEGADQEESAGKETAEIKEVKKTSPKQAASSGVAGNSVAKASSAKKGGASKGTAGRKV